MPDDEGLVPSPHVRKHWATKPNTSRTAQTQTPRILLRVTRADARITQDRQARKQRRADKITLQVEQLLDSHLAHSGRPPDHVE